MPCPGDRQGQAGAQGPAVPDQPCFAAAEKRSPRAPEVPPSERGADWAHGAAKRQRRVMEEAPRSRRSIGKRSGLRLPPPSPAENTSGCETHRTQGACRGRIHTHPPPRSPTAAGAAAVPRRFRGSQHPLLAPAPHSAGPQRRRKGEIGGLARLRPPPGRAGRGRGGDARPARPLPACRRQRTSRKFRSDKSQGRGKLGAGDLGVVGKSGTETTPSLTTIILVIKINNKASKKPDHKPKPNPNPETLQFNL